MAKSPFQKRPEALSARAYENVCNSKGHSVRVKTAYLRKIAACGRDELLAERMHETLLRAKSRSGPKAVDLLPDEGLGAFVELNNFIKYNSRAFGRSIANFQKQTEAMLSYHAKRQAGLTPTESERLATLSFMKRQCRYGLRAQLGYFVIRLGIEMRTAVCWISGWVIAWDFRYRLRAK
jgi:hypothetical protein